MQGIAWYPGHELFQTSIVKARNCELTDTQGRRFVDLESGVWCTCLGHCHPRVLEVLRRQAGEIGHTGFGYSSPVVRQAGKELLGTAGMEGGRCVFLCSGSEAVEYAVRVGRILRPEGLFLTLADSYFGAYGSAAEKRESDWASFDWSDCAACGNERPCGGDCPRFASIPWSDIAGFLFEPGSSSGLVRFPPRKLIQAIVDAVRERDGVVLVNEVTTGAGRTGLWFGCQHYEIEPDLAALGKGIGNGYPVSACLMAPGPASRLPAPPIRYSQSHQNDPLGAAVALEVVRTIMGEDLLAAVREKGAWLVKALEAMGERTGRVREVRGRGLMIAVELKDVPEGPLTIAAHRELARRGFLVCRRAGSSVLRIDPSFTIDKSDLERFVEALEEILAR